MAALPLNIEELSRRFHGQQKLACDEAGQALLQTALKRAAKEPDEPPATQFAPTSSSVPPPLAANRRSTVPEIDDDGNPSDTPLANIVPFRRRQGRRRVTPTPFVLQALQNSVGAAGNKALKQSDSRLGPSKRKLHMSPFAEPEPMESDSATRARRRRRVSLSGRRHAPLPQRRQSSLAPQEGGTPTPSRPEPIIDAVVEPIRTRIANTP